VQTRSKVVHVKALQTDWHFITLSASLWHRGTCTAGKSRNQRKSTNASKKP